MTKTRQGATLDASRRTSCTESAALVFNLFTRLVLHILHLIRAVLRTDTFDGVFDLNLACSLKYQRASYAIPFI